MSTGNALGLMPSLLPVTGTYLAPFTLMNAFLSIAVVRARVSTETIFGNETKPSTQKPTLKSTSADMDPVLLSTRVHGNFIENVPFAIAAAAIVELNGGSRQALTYTLGGLLLARISHVVGLTQGIAACRAGGYFASTGIIAGLGGWAIYLTKGYWGF